MNDLIDSINAQWASERPDLPTGALGLVNRIVVLDKYLQIAFAESLDKFGLTTCEFDVLATLLRHGAPYRLPATQLASSAMLSAGAMTNRVDRLLSRKLVVREPAENDRRTVNVRLSNAGYHLANQALTARVEMAQWLVSSLSEQEIGAASIILRRLLCSPRVAGCVSGNAETT